MKKITLILIWFVIVACIGCDPVKAPGLGQDRARSGITNRQSGESRGGNLWFAYL